MTIIDAFIIGVVEGVTEFLPISSTGHMILTGKLLHLQQTDFLKTFEISIQLGAIMAIVILYWRSLILNFNILKKVMAAFVPTAVIGFFLYKLVKHFLMGSYAVVLGALFIGGIILIVFEKFYKEKAGSDNLESISYSQAVLIGVAQAIAIIPGVSRSAATIVGGMCLGLKRKAMVEFSFLLAVPTMLAATALDLLKSSSSFSSSQFDMLVIGFGIAFVTAIGSVKFLIHFIQKNTFVAFGIYRIILAAMFLWWVI